MRSIAAALLLVLVAPAALGACASPPAAALRTHAPPATAHPYPTAAAGPVAVGADEVTVLVRGTTAFPEILSLIAAARTSVLVEIYELQAGEFLAALVGAHARGVAVTVITDPTASGSEAAALRLRAAGVDVVEYPVRRMTIDHVKLLVVDAEVAVVGGINWGTASAANHDFDVRVRGPVVDNLGRVVERDLVTCGRAATVPAPRTDPAITVASTLPFDEVRPLVLAAIDAARTRLDLELFVLTDIGIVHAVERAVARGVAVRVLLDPSQRPSDLATAELLARSVPVRLYASHGELLHAKAMIVDGHEVVFGSANWSGGGFSRNHEIDLDIRDSPIVAAAFLAAIDADWDASAVAS